MWTSNKIKEPKHKYWRFEEPHGQKPLRRELDEEQRTKDQVLLVSCGGAGKAEKKNGGEDPIGEIRLQEQTLLSCHGGR